MLNRLLTALYVLFCFEAGVCLLVLPWVSKLWSDNFFVDHYVWVSSLSRNYFVRGAVSGVGLVDIWLAFYEILLWLRRRRGVALKVPGPGVKPGCPFADLEALLAGNPA